MRFLRDTILALTFSGSAEKNYSLFTLLSPSSPCGSWNVLLAKYKLIQGQPYV